MFKLFLVMLAFIAAAYLYSLWGFDSSCGISPSFPKEIQDVCVFITAESKIIGVDPNQVATILVVESQQDLSKLVTMESFCSNRKCVAAPTQKDRLRAVMRLLREASLKFPTDRDAALAMFCPSNLDKDAYVATVKKSEDFYTR
jgi:hypothetical protein